MMVRPDMYTVDCVSRIFGQNKRHGMDPVSFSMLIFLENRLPVVHNFDHLL